jgi:hypothetical protein
MTCRPSLDLRLVAGKAAHNDEPKRIDHQDLHRRSVAIDAHLDLLPLGVALGGLGLRGRELLTTHTRATELAWRARRRRGVDRGVQSAATHDGDLA